MKILIINWRDITHPWAGGAERHIHELAKIWVKQGNHVTLLCGGYPKMISKENIDQIEIIRIGNTYSIFLLAPYYYLFYLKQRKFNVIIDTAHGIPFFSPIFSRLPKILIIHHNHKSIWKTEWNSFIAKIGSWIENNFVPFIYRNIQIVTLSETGKNELQQIGYKKVTAIKPGIHIPDPSLLTPKTINPTILYLGRLRKYKRVDLLLHFLNDIAREIPTVELIIAGEGQDRHRIEHLINYHHYKNLINFKGHVSEDEKYSLLSSCWILAFPSLIEGWGLVATEALSCNTPTVAFRVKGLSDSICHGKTGFLAQNKKEFITYIIELLSARKNMIDQKYKKMILDRYTWTKSASDFMKIINKEINHPV
jgi:glycosyltransferase involved in cell wall biosynthesis